MTIFDWIVAYVLIGEGIAIYDMRSQRPWHPLKMIALWPVLLGAIFLFTIAAHVSDIASNGSKEEDQS